jgi:hypothetical protein
MTKKSTHTQTPHVHSFVPLSSRGDCIKLIFLVQFHNTMRANVKPNTSKQSNEEGIQNSNIVLCDSVHLTSFRVKHSDININICSSVMYELFVGPFWIIKLN